MTIRDVSKKESLLPKYLYIEKYYPKVPPKRANQGEDEVIITPGFDEDEADRGLVIIEII